MVKQEALVEEVDHIDPKDNPDQSYFNSEKEVMNIKLQLKLLKLSKVLF